MDWLIYIFGEGKDLNSVQMSLRAIVLFFITLVLIRISGRRSFSMHTPLDTIVAILLGSILSRPAVGASPFIPTIAGCLVLALLHRFVARWGCQLKPLEKLLKGSRLLLYREGTFYEDKLARSLMSKEDLMEQVRINCQRNSLDDIQEVYMERNGKLSFIVKKKNH